MAVRRESRIEKQSSEVEVKERAAVQNQINPKTGRPENVDNMVSRFLAELTDLSSEMGQPAGKFKLEEQVASKSDPDLDRIDKEIEESLSELENLKPDFAPKRDKPLPDAQVIPAEPAVQDQIENPVKPLRPARIELPSDSEEQAWNRLEIFRNTVSGRSDRPMRGWVWAGAVLVVILGSVGFYLFRSEGSGDGKAVSQIAVSEPKQPDQRAASVEKTPAPTERPATTIDLKKESKPVDSGRSFQERARNKPVPRSTARSQGRDGSRMFGSSAAESQVRRPELPVNSAAPERPRTSEEPVRPASAQVAAPIPAQEQAVSAPPPAFAQLKSNPVLPAVSTASTPAAAPAPTREIPPAAPKPGTPAVAENTETAQPKAASKIPVMAEVIKKVAPEYPILARMQKIAGKVEVEAEIDEKGDVVRARAVSGPNALRFSAEEALKKWKFKPASVEGVNVPSKARIAVNFNLQ